MYYSLFTVDSVWPVYILPEEVGLRCQIIGQNILTLRSQSRISLGELEIISPTDHKQVVIRWDRDKLRRSGKVGNLAFVEIGRRCVGGPGLVWMYVGFHNAARTLRETLQR